MSQTASVPISSRLNDGVNFIAGDIDNAMSLVGEYCKFSLFSLINTIHRIHSHTYICMTWDSHHPYSKVLQENSIIGNFPKSFIVY